MNAIGNNLAMSNLQMRYNQNHIHGNMLEGESGHDMTKMNESTNVNSNITFK